MNALEIGVKNWQDGKAISGYCTSRNYAISDIFALREMHRLHLEQSAGVLGGSPMEALEVISNASIQQKQLLRSVGARTDPQLCDALIRMAENKDYAAWVLEAYSRDIKPNLNF